MRLCEIFYIVMLMVDITFYVLPSTSQQIKVKIASASQSGDSMAGKKVDHLHLCRRSGQAAYERTQSHSCLSQ